MVGWLNEGLRGGIKRGNQGGEVKTSIGISMLEAGRRRGAGGGDVTEISRRGEGDEADGWGPLGSDVRERRRRCRNVQSQRKYTFWQIQGCSGRMG
jgi:hypothetical protein